MRMKLSSRIAAVATAFTSLGFDAFGFPIEPVPLRQLVTESDLVATARVVPEAREQGQPIYSLLLRKSPARLSLSSILKGTNGAKVVEVHFDARLICPSPPDFPDETNMLVFLKRRRGAPGYETVALSYGVKPGTDEEIRSYSSRIRQLLQIEATPDSNDKLRQTVNWLVACTEDPVTRWDGAIELIDRVTLRNTTNVSPFAAHVTTSHLERLSNALFRTEFVRYDELALCTLFEQKAPRRVIDYLVTYLHRVKEPVGVMDNAVLSDSVPEPWVVYDAMWKVANLANDDTMKKFLETKLRTGFFSYVERTNSIQAFLPLVEGVIKRPGIRGSSQ